MEELKAVKVSFKRHTETFCKVTVKKCAVRFSDKFSNFIQTTVKNRLKICCPPLQVLLKTDSSWLMKSEASRDKPTIPCFLLFVIHVQQQELGGFTLPNDMFKWTKMRYIDKCNTMLD